MNTMTQKWARQALAMTAAAVTLAGCGDAVVAPEDSTPITALPAAREVELGACENLRPPAGATLAFHAYASGVQVYRWNGQAWQFTGPVATLTANAGGTGVVGSHYGGPTWEANSGGFIVGALSRRCDVDPANVPWLLLDVVRNEGPGVFSRVTHIQRVNTVGGQTPAGSGSHPGEVRNVPYTAEYFFYRAR